MVVLVATLAARQGWAVGNFRPGPPGPLRDFQTTRRGTSRQFCAPAGFSGRARPRRPNGDDVE